MPRECDSRLLYPILNIGILKFCSKSNVFISGHQHKKLWIGHYQMLLICQSFRYWWLKLNLFRYEKSRWAYIFYQRKQEIQQNRYFGPSTLFSTWSLNFKLAIVLVNFHFGIKLILILILYSIIIWDKCKKSFFTYGSYSPSSIFTICVAVCSTFHNIIYLYDGTQLCNKYL